MSDLDYDALRKVAEAATPGPWERPGANVFRVIAPEAEHRNKPFGKTPPYPWKIVADADPLGEPSAADTTHIATFDPPTVLRLLDLAQRAEAAPSAEVWCSPGRQSGQPCLTGTRMPTATIGRLIDGRGDVAFVHKYYPHLTEQQIWDAVEFESLNGRGKKYRKRLQALMRQRRHDLRAALDPKADQ